MIHRLCELYESCKTKGGCIFTVELDEQAESLFQKFLLDVKFCAGLISNNATTASLYLPYQAVKIASAFHACKHKVPHEDTINAKTMQAAIALCQYLRNHLEYAFSPIGFEAYTNAKAIHNDLCHIDTSLGSDTLCHGYITSRILKQRVKIYGQDFYNAIAFLRANGIVNVLDNGTESDDIILHPHYQRFTFH